MTQEGRSEGGKGTRVKKRWGKQKKKEGGRENKGKKRNKSEQETEEVKEKRIEGDKG